MFVEIITATGETLCSRAALVELPTADGQIGVMRGHQPMWLTLGTGYLLIHHHTRCDTFFAAGGFAKIKTDRILLTLD